MDSMNSARGSIPAQAPASPVYGLAEHGAPWSDCDRVLITVHGRGRTSDELPISFLCHPISRVTRILAPYSKSKSWYDGGYAAPRAENAAAVEEGISQIHAALERAAENGIPASRTVLAGFSQGGCMVAEYLLGGARRPAAAAIFTGSVIDISHPREAFADLSGMPIMLSGGGTDPWLPVTDLEATGALLAAAGADVRLQIFPDGDHVVRGEEMSLLDELVKRVAA